MIVGGDMVDDIVTLLKRAVAFAAYSLPEEDAINFVIDDEVSPVVSSRKFIINTWDGTKINILDRITVGQAMHYPIRNDFKLRTKRTTTLWEEYEQGINQVTELLKSTDGKVVVSRIKTINDARIDYVLIAKSAIEMFAVQKKAFRAIYFTPKTGAWCVCSPELLLNIDKKSGELSTVALAGTRNGVTKEKWDDKNVREHSYVVKHISDSLKAIGVTPTVDASETLTTGNIQHILTRIRGNIAEGKFQKKIDEIVEALHPTPAISGYPINWSREVIGHVEQHNRECYGGYIAIDDEERYMAYVNLRSFAFEPGSCCFWGGGGIMKDSSPRSEWNESELKMESTLTFIRKRLEK